MWTLADVVVLANLLLATWTFLLRLTQAAVVYRFQTDAPSHERQDRLLKLAASQLLLVAVVATLAFRSPVAQAAGAAAALAFSGVIAFGFAVPGLANR